MQVTRTCTVTGETNTRDINITEQQLAEHAAGGLIQNVAPNLSADDREFLISGMSPETWDSLFGEED